MKKIDEYYVPWIKGIPMYVSGHIELAWKIPELHRMMSNENPNPPSEKVLDALIKYAKMSNRYPDQGLVVRGKIAEINGLSGPENVMLGNGSSEVYDNIFRCFLAPGEEVIQHTPCFGIYKLRGTILDGKMAKALAQIADADRGVHAGNSSATPYSSASVVKLAGNPL